MGLLNETLFLANDHFLISDTKFYRSKSSLDSRTSKIYFYSLMKSYKKYINSILLSYTAQYKSITSQEYYTKAFQDTNTHCTANKEHK